MDTFERNFMFKEDLTGKTVEYTGGDPAHPASGPVAPGTRGIVESMYTNTVIVRWEGKKEPCVVEHACIKLVNR